MLYWYIHLYKVLRITLYMVYTVFTLYMVYTVFTLYMVYKVFTLYMVYTLAYSFTDLLATNSFASISYYNKTK